MKFTLKDYGYEPESQTAWFSYENNGFEFIEKFQFARVTEGYDQAVLDRALFLAFVLVGTSYYKTFPSHAVSLEKGALDDWQVQFFNTVYQEGMSQFASENELTRNHLAHFQAAGTPELAVAYIATDSLPLILQSGGKDSLLLAQTLTGQKVDFSAFHIANSDTHPAVIDTLPGDLHTVRRQIDAQTLRQAAAAGGADGHVPVSYIVFAVALIQAVLSGKSTVLAAIGHEGEEPYDFIGDLPVTHQWSKTWSAEQAVAEYIGRYISPDLRFGSPLRRYSELKIAELFVQKCWADYSRSFSSCNVGNYKQGQDNTTLGWCGNCPKCANSFLLFAPFVEPSELAAVFNGENLFKKDSLTQTFKGLLDIDGAVKPFECVGETDELRLAYQMAHEKSDEYTLPFEVPESHFDYEKEYPAQPWTDKYI